MRSAARVAGVAGVAALGAMTFGGTALADTAGNDGINLLDDNNVNAIPIQLCDNNIAAAIGVIIPIASPQASDCNNSAIVDHPKVD
ncbi:hypothetical protein [Saccharopolyspora cebuensis]|uniref:Small secreted domain n=1 Tax=Saccharopolyspora cebuensis TaxID=418759 RepID=A0ABV4CCC2_9PSEU